LALGELPGGEVWIGGGGDSQDSLKSPLKMEDKRTLLPNSIHSAWFMAHTKVAIRVRVERTAPALFEQSAERNGPDVKTTHYRLEIYKSLNNLHSQLFNKTDAQPFFTYLTL
jgi:hypothetical protein